MHFLAISIISINWKWFRLRLEFETIFEVLIASVGGLFDGDWRLEQLPPPQLPNIIFANHKVFSYNIIRKNALWWKGTYFYHCSFFSVLLRQKQWSVTMAVLFFLEPSTRKVTPSTTIFQRDLVSLTLLTIVLVRIKFGFIEISWLFFERS